MFDIAQHSDAIIQLAQFSYSGSGDVVRIYANNEINESASSNLGTSWIIPVRDWIRPKPCIYLRVLHCAPYCSSTHVLHYCSGSSVRLLTPSYHCHIWLWIYGAVVQIQWLVYIWSHYSQDKVDHCRRSTPPTSPSLLSFRGRQIGTSFGWAQLKAFDSILSVWRKARYKRAYIT